MAIWRKPLFSAVSRILSSNPTGARSLQRPLSGVVSRFYSSDGSSESRAIDLNDIESRRRLFNRLMYRSKQRGYLELDLILGKWVEDNIEGMNESGIKFLMQLLDKENPDLWSWLSGQEEPPEAVSENPVFEAVREEVADKLKSHASPATRATAGQPWVRGWDDYKKGRDGPIAGNQ